MKNIIDTLNWRYATKKFDATKTIKSEDISTIEEALGLTPSSFGLQPWKFIWVKNPDIRKNLVDHSWGQAQVSDASHLLILCRKNNLDSSLVEAYISDMIGKTGAPAEALQGYKDMMLGFISNTQEETLKIWAEKQVYIALGNIMTVLATMEIDSCPMEGFSNEKYDEILGLSEKGLSSVLVLPIGYRSPEDESIKRPKIRYNREELFLEI